LRERLDESNRALEAERKSSKLKEENLKKAHMRTICALNYEAMNILNPNDPSY